MSQQASKDPPSKAPKADDDEKWPEDATDEPESKLNDDERISIRIAPVNEAKARNKMVQNIVIELTAPNKKRAAVDICAVIDVSGSMCSSAAVQEDDGSVKNDDGLNVLDLVKHSIRTVMHCLGENDRLSIVPFSNNANIHHPLSNMTQDGIKKAEAALLKLSPGGCTNLWEGLRVGMESLRNKQQQGRLSVVMLLTDGQPTEKPAGGYITALKNYIDATDFQPQINTFGFGYNLDSELLHSLAVSGNGTFAFIPDSLIVGTTFVNSVSNVLTTISTNTTLNLTAMNGATFEGKSWGAHTEQDESWGKRIEFGPITCGGSRYVSVPMKLPKDESKAYLEVVLSNGLLGASPETLKRGKSKQNQSGVARERKLASDLVAGHLTAKVVSIGMEATSLTAQRKEKEGLLLLEALKKEIKAVADVAAKSETDDFNEMSANSRVEALNTDVQGRLNKSFQGLPRFNRWGKHYLRALLRAHQVNLCTNFMDPGLQVNGGDLFQEMRAKGDEVFVNLPAPKPSNAPRTNVNNQAQAVNMNTYYGGCGGGCFAPQSSVVVMNVCTKECVDTKVCDVRVGDLVKVADGFATVRFVVELARDARRRMIEFAGGLVITGGHPIRRNGKWCKPREESDARITDGCDTVYTFVLDESHVLLVNGVECITWCHGMKDEVVNDEFYGTQKVMEALQRKSMEIEHNSESRCRNVGGDPLGSVIAVYQ